MISIGSLHFAYPQDGFSLNIPAFSVPPGEKLAVIGPSGSGKTTLLNLIAGIYPPEPVKAEDRVGYSPEIEAGRYNVDDVIKPIYEEAEKALGRKFEYPTK